MTSIAILCEGNRSVASLLIRLHPRYGVAMLVLVSFIEVLLLTKISMKNLLHKNVSYKTIGTIFSIFVLIAIIGSDKFSSTPTAPTSSTQEGFYTNSKKGFTA
jgi:hypothetical protein